MNPKTRERKTYSVRLSEDAIQLIKKVDEDHKIGSQAETLEWMIARAGGDLEVREMVRKMWVHELASKHGADAPVGVLISGGQEKNAEGSPVYTARVKIDGKAEPTLAADAVQVDRGGLEIILRNPENENFPFLIFDRYTVAQVSDLLASTGWEGSTDLLVGVARKVSELGTLPLLDAPGDRTPEDHARPE